MTKKWWQSALKAMGSNQMPYCECYEHQFQTMLMWCHLSDVWTNFLKYAIYCASMNWNQFMLLVLPFSYYCKVQFCPISMKFVLFKGFFKEATTWVQLSKHCQHILEWKLMGNRLTLQFWWAIHFHSHPPATSFLSFIMACWATQKIQTKNVPGHIAQSSFCNSYI